MALLPIFRGLARPDGTLVLRETEREKRHQWLRAVAGPSGHAIEVIVRREPRQRSLDVNAYIHAVPVTLVSHHTGEDVDTTKLQLMGACFGHVFGPDGQLVPVKGHTASMTDEEGSHFIEWCPPWALHNLGIEIPLPGEVEFRL